jgi:hypothetical protein
MGGRRANARPAPILGTHLGAQFWGRGCNWAPILGGRAQVGAPTAGGVLFTQPEGAPESVARIDPSTEETPADPPKETQAGS